MDDTTTMEILKILITIIVAVIGWIIGHYFTSKRDKLNKKRELILKELMTAYRILTNEISHRELNKERFEMLEQVLTDIQLFGTTEQIDLAKQLSNEVARKSSFELDPLINNLRSALRHELDLKEVVGNVIWLRFDNKQNK